MSSSSSSILILSSADVDQVLSSLDPTLVLTSQSNVFTSYSLSHPSHLTTDSQPDETPLNQVPNRLVLNSEEMVMLFMPSRINKQTGCKIVSVPRKGGLDGLPATTVVMDEITGKVKAIVNARKLTALRNAAGSAISVKVAGVTPNNLVIFGSGAQAEAHAMMFFKLFSISKCTLIVRTVTPRSITLFNTLSTLYPGLVSLHSSSDPNFSLSETVRSATVILTLTPSTVPLFASSDVSPGTHLVLVGSYKPTMREVDNDLIKRAGVVIVDSKEACKVEAGELIGIGEAEMQELGEVLGKGEMIKNGDVTIFKSVGIGLQDIAIANVVLAEAERLGLGTRIENYD